MKLRFMNCLRHELTASCHESQICICIKGGAIYKVSAQSKGMVKNSAERTKRSIMRIKPHNTLPEGVRGYVERFDEFVVQWHINK